MTARHELQSIVGNTRRSIDPLWGGPDNSTCRDCAGSVVMVIITDAIGMRALADSSVLEQVVSFFLTDCIERIG
jgi:hypothetical protein